MSDIHILQGNFKNNGSGRFQIAYHIPVPAAYQNGTTASYPADATRTSVVADISVPEQAEIEAGTIFEHVESFPVNVNIDVAQTTAAIRAKWHTIQNVAGTRIAQQYKHYGTTLDRS